MIGERAVNFTSLLCVLFVVQTPIAQTSLVAKCPQHLDKSVILPHPFDCSLSFQCNAQDVQPSLLLRCPDGLHATHMEHDKCGHKDTAHCNAKLPPVQVINVAETNQSFYPLCPHYEALNYTFYLPNHRNCTQFFMCYQNKRHFLECPRGLYFNAVFEVCDLPEVAGCDDACKDVPVPSCPEYGTGFQMPNPVDCGSFYKCNWDTPILFHCGLGLHYNPKYGICDWPYNAQCKLCKNSDIV